MPLFTHSRVRASPDPRLDFFFFILPIHATHHTSGGHSRFPAALFDSVVEPVPRSPLLRRDDVRLRGGDGVPDVVLVLAEEAAGGRGRAVLHEGGLSTCMQKKGVGEKTIYFICKSKA